jgi:hypothetical protein
MLGDIVEPASQPTSVKTYADASPTNEDLRELDFPNKLNLSRQRESNEFESQSNYIDRVGDNAYTTWTDVAMK